MNKEIIIKYFGSNLQPIDFIEEYHKKTLPVSILFYKIVKTFPKEKIGAMKGAFRHIHEAKLNHLGFFLDSKEISEIVKNQNNFRPKIGQYIEFLTLSLINSCLEKKDNLKLASFNEDISQGWDFSINNIRYDITSNPNKITKKDIKKLVILESSILDKDGLVLNNFCFSINQILMENNIFLNLEKLDFCNLIINKIRSKYIENYNHKVNLIEKPNLEILITAKEDSSIEVPSFGEVEIQSSKINIKAQEASYEEIELLSKIKTLNPFEQRTLIAFLDDFISKKQ